jgi:peptidoglycan/LPS O-acetylase OafA/YrhL
VRALAVLAVMGFHEGAPELPGGFLGVDIFFVLSGFLITDLLVAQYDRDGRLDLKNFWARRARRLLPALAVMLVVVTAATTMIEPGQQASLRLALLAAATYTSNWYQVLHHVSYFAALGPPAPLDHLWSLAIEEQFYLIWPLVLWFFIIRRNGRRACLLATLLAAAMSALAMALEYTPGGDPSAVYYGTGTHASALLIGAVLALAYPLTALASASAAQARRLDAAGIAGLAALAWAIGHFSGRDPAVYPVGLILAALGAAGLVAAAASNGVIAAITSVRPLRWLGIRSYGIYLWHWPTIALTAALAGSGATSAWLWLIETVVTIALAAVSWRFIETPILQNGLRATCRHWVQSLGGVRTRPAGRATEAGRLRPADRLGRAVPVAVTAVAVLALATAGYAVARPPAPAAPPGLLRQVAEGERVSAASQSAGPASLRQAAAEGRKPAAECRRGRSPKVSGGQVTAVGDSVMVASAAALEAAIPGIYIDAQIGRQMQAGLAVVRSLAARGMLRRVVIIGLGTNGTVTAGQIRQLRHAIGPGRDLVLVNTFDPRPWEHEVNAAINAAARQAGRVVLANWDQAIAARPYLLWRDQVHPQPAGAKLYAHVVLAAVRTGLSRSQPAACPG